MMVGISTHVLDTSSGRGAVGVGVVLELMEDSALWRSMGKGATDGDGRIKALVAAEQALVPGNYRLIFDTGPYFLRLNIDTFFPEIMISFFIKEVDEHYHVPLLLSPFGYSTYRGS